MRFETNKVAKPSIRTLMCGLLKIGGLAVLLQNAAFADQVSQGGPTTDAAIKTSTVEQSGRQMLAKDGGLPASVLRMHFAAVQARDWSAVMAVTVGEIRTMMEEDEEDGYHLSMLDSMKAKSPAEIEILEGWILDEVAFLRYQGLGTDRQRKGTAELLMEEGEWKITVVGLE